MLGPMTSRITSANRGFTLVETTIVLLVIAMVVVISVPNLLRSRTKAAMLEQVRTLQQSLSVARISAIRGGSRVVVAVTQDLTGSSGWRVRAWSDENGDDAFQSGEDEVGEWRIRSGYTVQEDAADPVYKLGGGAAPGFVFLPSGSAIVDAAGHVGVGDGSLVVSDRHGNEIRLEVTGGAATVRRQMKDFDGAWRPELRYWRY